MIDKPTPTDAELKAMWQIHAADIGGIFYYARAVLAKWGQPAQAAEPADTVVLTAAQESLGVEFEKVLHDNLFDLYEESPHTARLDKTTPSAYQSSADSYHKNSNKGRNMIDIDAAIAAQQGEKHE